MTSYTVYQVAKIMTDRHTGNKPVDSVYVRDDEYRKGKYVLVATAHVLGNIMWMSQDYLPDMIVTLKLVKEFPDSKEAIEFMENIQKRGI